MLVHTRGNQTAASGKLPQPNVRQKSPRGQGFFANVDTLGLFQGAIFVTRRAKDYFTREGDQKKLVWRTLTVIYRKTQKLEIWIGIRSRSHG